MDDGVAVDFDDENKVVGFAVGVSVNGDVGYDVVGRAEGDGDVGYGAAVGLEVGLDDFDIAFLVGNVAGEAVGFFVGGREGCGGVASRNTGDRSNNQKKSRSQIIVKYKK